MLFYDNILVCRISRDFNYANGDSIDMQVTFGGTRRNYKYERCFELLKEWGVLPKDARYLEYKHEDSVTVITYYVVRKGEEVFKTHIEYRKVTIPNTVKSWYDVKGYAISEIISNLNAFYFLKGDNVELISNSDSCPNIDDIREGLKFAKSLVGNCEGVENVDGYAYCSIGGNTYILVTVEGSVRELILLPLEYSREYLAEYLKVTTSLNNDKIEELLSSYLN